MNKKQKIALWAGITVMAAMGIYPPWDYKESTQYAVASPIGFSWIFLPAILWEHEAPVDFLNRAGEHNLYPGTGENEALSAGYIPAYVYRTKAYEEAVAKTPWKVFLTANVIDTTRLIIQWAVVALITGGLILTFKSSSAPSQ